MITKTLLAQPHLSVITRHADSELRHIQDLIEHRVLVDGRAELEALFGALLGNPEVISKASPKTLDLIGHSTPGKSLLLLGDWVIDAANPTVTAYFRELADQEVFPRLGITALRLLGCRTADTGAGRATILALADLLGVEVFGTRGLIYAAHYDARGFADERRYALVGSRELAIETSPPANLPAIEAWPQELDIDALPSAAGVEPTGAWTHRVATAPEMREVLRHVQRRDGAQMPGLLAAPHSELVFPGHAAGTYRRAQVVLDGEFVRFFPRGAAAPGIVFAVADPHSLLQVIATLPSLPTRHALPPLSR
ncbi:MAG: hypothetical protein NT062_32510 [Proteobacteria bacterium]|nr:hypothetical protein [Pseudomonadota bacterium]